MDAPDGDVSAFEDVIRLLIQRGDLDQGDLRILARLVCVARPLRDTFAPFLTPAEVFDYRPSSLERDRRRLRGLTENFRAKVLDQRNGGHRREKLALELAFIQIGNSVRGLRIVENDVVLLRAMEPGRTVLEQLACVIEKHFNVISAAQTLAKKLRNGPQESRDKRFREVSGECRRMKTRLDRAAEFFYRWSSISD